MSKQAYGQTPEQTQEQAYERNSTNPERIDPTGPEPQPRDAVYAAQWGPTPVPIQEPADTPKGAKPGALLILGTVLLVALVVLIVALVRS